MLGILLIYFIGKSFYDLAFKYNRTGWGFAVLGVFAYYAGTFVAGIATVIFYDLFLTTTVDNIEDKLLSLIALPFGLLACWGLYKYLEHSWEQDRTSISNSQDLLDDDFLQNSG